MSSTIPQTISGGEGDGHGPALPSSGSISKSHVDLGIMRIPIEIWQHIFSAGIASVIDDHRNLRYDPPVNGHDVLLQSLEFSCGPPRHPTPCTAVGDMSYWALALRLKKTFVLVCRTWWAAGIAELYSHVYLHRVAQLPALVRTLELEGSLSRPRCGFTDDERALGYGRWISQITIDFHIPHMWRDVYCDAYEKLLALCPSLRVLIHSPIFTAPLFKTPLSKDFFCFICPSEDETQQLPQTDAYGTTRDCVGGDSPLQHLRHLTLRSTTVIPPKLGIRLPFIFTQLTSLELGLLHEREVSQPGLRLKAQNEELCLPNLRILALTVSMGVVSPHQVNYIIERWRLPTLRRLFLIRGDTLDFETSRQIHPAIPPPLTHQIIGKLLAAHGPQLERLFIDGGVCARLALEDLLEFLVLCPRLQDVAFSCHEWRTRALDFQVVDKLRKRASSHDCLRSVTTYIGVLDPAPDDSQDSLRDVLSSDFGLIFQELQSKKHYPALKVIRLSQPRLVDLRIFPPTDRMSPERVRSAGTQTEHSAGETPGLDLRHCILEKHVADALSTWAHMAQKANIEFVNNAYQRINPLELNDVPSHLSAHNDDDDSSDSTYQDSDKSLTTSYEDSDEGSDDALIPSDDEMIRVTETQWWLEARQMPAVDTRARNFTRHRGEGSSHHGIAVKTDQVGLEEGLDIFESTLSTSSCLDYDADADDDDDDDDV